MRFGIRFLGGIARHSCPKDSFTQVRLENIIPLLSIIDKHTSTNTVALFEIHVSIARE